MRCVLQNYLLGRGIFVNFGLCLTLLIPKLMINPVFWLVPSSAVVALLLAWYFYREMLRQSEGLRFRPSEPVGARRFPYRRLFLGPFGLLRHEDRHVCLGAYGQRRP